MMVPAEPPQARASLHLADLLLPFGVALWVLGVSRTNTSALGPYGLPAVLPVVFYAGIALLIVSAATELFHARISTWRMSAHAAALSTMLYGTAPLVYAEGRYAWLYKTIGVVQYVNAHGQLNSHIDIYQNWPGFFALAAWFDKIAGVGSPLAYAKWAQLVFEIAAIPILYLIYETLSLSVRQRWVAVLLYLASNWIGQDYFSPQALGALLSLGIMALVMRWLYRPAPPRRQSPSSRRPNALEPRESTDPARPIMTPFQVPLAICAIFAVLTFTHQLSPYMVVVQVSALAVARLMRARWLPVALAAIAIGYLLPHLSYVNTHFGLLTSFGDFFHNAAPPSFGFVKISPEQRVIQHCAEALSAGIWALAILGAWLRRRSLRLVLALVGLAFSPIVLLALQAYGTEGALRVYLFSLPWCAALGAMALVPPPPVTGHRARHARFLERLSSSAEEGPDDMGRVPDERPRIRGAVRVPVALMAAVALFFPAFFGDDASNVMPQAEVRTVTSFLRHATPGTLYCAIVHAPVADTAKYDQFPLRPLFGPNSLLGSSLPGRHLHHVGRTLARLILQKSESGTPTYIMIAPSMFAYNNAYKSVRSGIITDLQLALAHSRNWKLLAHSPGTWIYELRPTVPTTPQSLVHYHF